MEADGTKTAEDALAEICTSIGFEMTAEPVVNQERWRNTSIPERIQIFMNWLGHARNKKSILIVDDIEAFGYSNTRSILKYPVQHLLVSTSDSNLIGMGRDYQEVRLSPLGNDDVMSILRDTLDSLRRGGNFSPGLGSKLSRSALKSIARTLHGHPLAARNAISFINQDLPTLEDPSAAFVEMFDSYDPEERRRFLEHHTAEDISLWDAFDKSLQRLRLQKQTDNAIKLSQLLPYLNGDCIDEFLQIDKRWLRHCENEMPNVAMLNSGYVVVSGWLSKLRGVSLYVRGNSCRTFKALNVHPLVMQYLLLQVGEKERVSLLRQLLQLFYGMERRGAHRDTHVRPHVLQCVKVCQEFEIPLINLELSSIILQWVKGFFLTDLTNDVSERPTENPFLDQGEAIAAVIDDFARACLQAKDTLARNDMSSVCNGATYTSVERCRRAYTHVKGTLGDPDALPVALRTKLGEVIMAFEEIVRRSRSIYPELPRELTALRKRLVRG